MGSIRSHNSSRLSVLQMVMDFDDGSTLVMDPNGEIQLVQHQETLSDAKCDVFL